MALFAQFADEYKEKFRRISHYNEDEFEITGE